MPKREPLVQITAWCAKHLVGDEKGEAQISLDHLFEAFGHAGGLKEAGATLEMRVAKADGGGTSFADLVWKPVVLIEMKKRGENLQKHYRQAFDNWTRLVPNRPRYAVLCNFDKFGAFDFESNRETQRTRLQQRRASQFIARSADNPVRLREEASPRADKNVGAPKFGQACKKLRCARYNKGCAGMLDLGRPFR